ncbi:hypothetical protein WJ90_12710 [Burkholderia ubonensis]|nr:hypothetical protein WJ90_12710 [Burkholderia ubonensis]KVR56880.1 hypothetical protein WK16_23995 [Burkholderia ubonensis]KVW26938.1 hypothetical protein WK94_10470 [Burkholderia ubonensis]
MQLRKIIKTRGHFTNDEAAIKLLCKRPAKSPLGVNCRQSSADGSPAMRQKCGDVVGAMSG